MGPQRLRPAQTGASNPNNSRGREDGFSFVELVVAMALIGLVGLLAANVLARGYRQNLWLSEEFDMRSAGLEALRQIEYGFVDEDGRQWPGVREAERVDSHTFNEFVVKGRYYDPSNARVAPEVERTVTYKLEEGALLRKVSAEGGFSRTLPDWELVLEDVKRISVCRPRRDAERQANQIVLEIELEREGSPLRRVELAKTVYVRNSDDQNTRECSYALQQGPGS